MCNKLWFLTQNDMLLDVYEEEENAFEKQFFFKEENCSDNFSIFSVNSTEIAKYPNEFDFARDRGLLND